MSTVATQQPAPPGTYTTAGAAVPTKCLKRFYNPYTAQASCLPCKAGFYCDEEGMTDNLKDCPKGHFCVDGEFVPAKCDVGTYMNEFNAKVASDCKACQPGKFCDSQGLEYPTGDCDQGYFCTSGATTSSPDVADTANRFGPCPAGFYCPTGSAYPVPCP